jgi:hypothetical protein
MKLPEIRSAMYKVFTAGQLTEIEAETLDALINARAVVPPIEAPATRRVGSRPRLCINGKTPLLGRRRPIAARSGSAVYPGPSRPCWLSLRLR